MKNRTNINTRPAGIPYCYPTVLPTKRSLRLTFADTLPIRCDHTITLWKDWRGKTPPNETLFAAWNSLDARLCHQFLQLGNDWRTSRKRPQWIVFLEQVRDGNKHLHGIVQCLPHIGIDDYRHAFEDACLDCFSVRGFVTEVDPPRTEIAWKRYATKMMKYTDRSEAIELDYRFSPNFPPWKDTDM